MADDATTTTEAGAEVETQQQTQEPAGPDLSGVQSLLDDRIGAFEDRFGQMLDQLTPQQQQEEPDPFEQYDDPAIRQLVEQNRSLTQRLDSIDQRAQSTQTEFAAQQLIREFPDLEKPDVFEPVVARAAQEMQRMGINTPDGSIPPHMVRLAYLAGRAEQYAAAERDRTAAQGADTPLETAAGTSPGMTEDDEGDRIINARRNGHGWF